MSLKVGGDRCELVAPTIAGAVQALTEHVSQGRHYPWLLRWSLDYRLLW